MEANGSKPYSLCDMHFAQNRVFGANPSEEWEGLRTLIDDLYEKCETSGSYVHCAPLERYLISMFPFAFDRDDVTSNDEVVADKLSHTENDRKEYRPLAAIPDYNPYRKFDEQNDNIYDHPWAGSTDGGKWAAKIIEWCGFATQKNLDNDVIPDEHWLKFKAKDPLPSDAQKEAASNTFACILYLSTLVLPNNTLQKRYIINIADFFLENNTDNSFKFDKYGNVDNSGNICWYHSFNFGKASNGDHIDCEEMIGVYEKVDENDKKVKAISGANALNPGSGYTGNCRNNTEKIKYPCAITVGGLSAYGNKEVFLEDSNGWGEMSNAAWYVRALHAGVAPWPNASMFPEGSRWEEALANIISNRDLSVFTTDTDDNNNIKHTDNYIGPKPDISAPPEIDVIESRYAELSDEIDLKTPATYEAGAAAAAIQYLGWGGFGNAVKVTHSDYAEHLCGPDIAFKSSSGEEGPSITIPRRTRRLSTRSVTYLYKLHVREKIDKNGQICIPKYASLGAEGLTPLRQGTELGDRWSVLHDNTNTIWEENTTAQITFEPDFTYSEKVLRNIADSINIEFKNDEDQNPIEMDEIVEHFSAYTAQSIIDNNDGDSADDISFPLVELIRNQPATNPSPSAEMPKDYSSIDASKLGACRFVVGGGDLLKEDSELWWECIWTIGTTVETSVEYGTDDPVKEPDHISVDTFPSWVIQIPYQSIDGEPVHGTCYLVSADTEVEGEIPSTVKECFSMADATSVRVCGTREASAMYAMWEKILDKDIEKKNCRFIRNRTFRKEGNINCGSPYNYAGRGTKVTIFTSESDPCKQIETVPWMARGWNLPSPWDDGAVNDFTAPWKKSIFETATWPISSSKRNLFFRGNYICDPSSNSGGQYWRGIEKFGNLFPSIPSMASTRGIFSIRRYCNPNPAKTPRPIIPSIAYPSVRHISPHRWVGWSDQVFTEEKADNCTLGGSLEYERNETCWHAGLEIAHRARWMAGGIQAEDGPPFILPHSCHPKYRGQSNTPGSCVLGDSDMRIYPTQPWLSDRHFCEGDQDGSRHDGDYLTRKRLDGEVETIKVKNKFVDCGYRYTGSGDSHESIYDINDCADDSGAYMGYVPSGDICRRYLAMYSLALKQGLALRATSHVYPQEQLAKRVSNCSSQDPTEEELLYNKEIDCTYSTSLPRSRYSWHEMGSAIDFTKGPDVIDNNSAEFFWLFLNAYRFGFQNLPSEAWHWSPMGA